jgi:acylglycerol lipase
MHGGMRWLPILFLIAPLLACGHTPTPSPVTGDQPPRLAHDHILTDDGYRLPLFHRPTGRDTPGGGAGAAWLRRPLGRLPGPGRTLRARGHRPLCLRPARLRCHGRRRALGGQVRLARDARLVAQLLRQRYPDTPLYLVGKSMGGAVALLAMAGATALPVDGVALIAPAVWARKTMPWYQRWGLRLLARIAPGLELTGNAARRLGIRPTDDPAVRRALSLDPLVQKRFRVATLDGLTHLMDRPWQSAPRLPGPALLLYGEQDQIIPPGPSARCWRACRIAAIRPGAWPSIQRVITCLPATPAPRDPPGPGGLAPRSPPPPALGQRGGPGGSPVATLHSSIP